MKRYFVLALLSLVLFYSASHYLLFLYQRHEVRQSIKQQIKQNIPEQSLLTLTFQDNSKDWCEIVWLNDHEFIYQDQFYDVISKDCGVQGQIILKCINDKQEERLFQNLDILINDRMEAERGIKGNIGPAFLLLTYFLNEAFQLPSHSDYQPVQHLPELMARLTEAYLDIATPPPRHA